VKAVIYARYSSDAQREESIEGQLRECGEFAERKGYTIVKTYADRAISGKKADNRPQFMQMIEDSKQKLFNTVIVWKIDRFSRDKYDSVFYKNALKKNGVSVISATEPIDDSPEGQLMESIFEGFSAYYIKDLAMKVNRGMTENALKCKFNGGSPTYGYFIDEHKHFQPDPVKALVVADIFRRYSGGESLKSILSSLQGQGLQTGHGKPPTYSFLVNLIKNRRYLGEYRFKDTVVENAFTPLVEPDIFEKCQRRLVENQRRPAHFKTVADKYLLTGKSYCGYCGTSMCGESGKSKTGVIHRYYQCRAAKTKRTCDKKRISKDFLETAVTDISMQFFDNAPLLNSVVDNCFELQSRKNANLPALESQLEQVNKEIDNVMTAIKQGIITPTTKETLLKLEQDKGELEVNIAKERIERPVLSREQIKFGLCRFSTTNLDDSEQKQRLIEVFVNSIYVYDDKFVITFNYNDGDKCVTFDEVNEMFAKRKNSDNHKDYQSSPLERCGDP
jgi:DNA invertase Pin-like site-specific DNA recombinase